MTREIILDTETTGMDPERGDKIIEIGALELINHLPSGKTYHVYLDPERDVPPEAVAVHGITREMLRGKPLFNQEFVNFLDFLGTDGKLVIHNASFDMKFINYELKQVGHPGIKPNRVIDSLDVARKKFPGSPASLDALCRRYDIDLSGRTLHGALLDAELLAEVWLELNGGRQHGLDIGTGGAMSLDAPGHVPVERMYREARVFDVPAEEQDAHAAMVAKLKEAVWAKIN